jgi:DNA (cytosine-5)-methyltransferase 1
MNRPRLLDLFCGAGGVAAGYHRAGLDVVGVDLAPQPRFPFPFVQADALEYLATHGREFDVIHASPPCQGYSRLRHLPWLKGRTWPKLIDPCREMLDAIGRPWVMENVADAPLRGVTLCGRMFGLPVYRHRLFESSVMLMQPPHPRHVHIIGPGRLLNDRRKAGRDPAFRIPLNAGSRKGAWALSPLVTVAGGQFKKEHGAAALGIDWMTTAELSQAIPPAYTHYLGLQLLAILETSA